MADHEALVAAFCELTSSSTAQATEYLTATNWEIDPAVTAFYADQDEPSELSTSNPAESAAPPGYTGPRTLDGRPAPEESPSSSVAQTKKPAKRTGVATLGSIAGHSHNHDDDSNRGDLFAGGEKSALAVQDPSQRSSDPRNLLNDIVAKAKAASSRPPGASESDSGPSHATAFRGDGMTLGGDGVESRRVVDPRGAPVLAMQPTGPRQERTLHIWPEGFSIDDGPLHAVSDPANQAILHMIRQGHAPLHLMNVTPGQHVDVKLKQHSEKYRPLPKMYRPFGGEGRRLGSPVPGDAPSSALDTAQPAQPGPAAAAASQASSGADESQPTLSLRIQLPDGTRLPARFNHTQTVGDVYAFVQRSSLATSSRGWVLATTFPSKDHTDKDSVLGEMPEFKRGGIAVVKWV